MKSKSLFLSAIAIAGMASANAQQTTTPVGYEQITIQQSAFNYIGIRLHESVLVSGDMAATSATTVQDAGADFSSLTGANTFYVLEVTSGSGDGTIVEFTGANVSGDVITVPDDLQSLGTFNYNIRQAATLTSVFGAKNTAGLAGGFFGPTGADVIYVPDGSGGFDTYYYDTFQNDPGPSPTQGTWANASNNAPVDGAVVPLVYAEGVLINASSSAPASITVSGEVKTSPTQVTIIDGFNYLTPVAPVGATLTSTFGAKNTAGLAGGFFGPTGADVIYIPNGSGGFNTYYYDTFQNDPGPSPTQGTWANASNNAPVDGSTIDLAPSGFLISTTAGAKNVTLAVPSGYSGL